MEEFSSPRGKAASWWMGLTASTVPKDTAWLQVPAPALQVPKELNPSKPPHAFYVTTPPFFWSVYVCDQAKFFFSSTLLKTAGYR